MTSFFSRLRLLLERADRSWIASLLLRLGLVLILLGPWDYRFVPVSFAREDLDSRLLARANELGVDLLDPRQWPHVSDFFLRVAALILLVTLAWWGLSRLRQVLRRRWGSGMAWTIVLGMGPVIQYLGFVGGNRILLWAAFQDALPVWGGWIQSRLVLGTQPNIGFLRQTLTLTLLALFVDVILTIWSEQRRLEEAERLALGARMAPHFLFNALNVLRAQIERDEAAALAMTDRLSRLLRNVFQATLEPRVPLARELELVEDYLGLEKARLGERLKVSFDISENTMDCFVPVLGLQVLVENAIRHGVDSSSAGGEVEIEARRDGNDLLIRVIDPGHGASAPGLGAALDNLRRRLDRPSDLLLESIPMGFSASLRVAQSEVRP